MAFVASKLGWLVAQPGNFLLLLLCTGAALLFTHWRGFGRMLVGVVAALFAAIAVLPVGDWLLIPLEERFPPPRDLPSEIDGVVVLGGGVDPYQIETRGMPSVTDNAERFIAAVDLARRYPEARIVYTGGDPTLQGRPYRETDAARLLFPRMGLTEDRLLLEGESRNTYENALYSKRLADPQPGETWLLVTSAWHMPRSVGVFRMQGWDIVPYPVDYVAHGRYWRFNNPSLANGLRGLNRGVREWIGLLAYRLLGYSDSLFPAPEG